MEHANKANEGLDIGWIISTLLRWWWIVLICALVAAAATYFITASMRPVYEASATLLVQPSQDQQMSEYDAVVLGSRLAVTYSQLLNGKPVLTNVIKRLGLDETPDSLSNKITTTTVKDTQLIKLTVTDTSKNHVALIANTIAEVFTEQINEKQAERYASSLKSIQSKMDTLNKQIEETKSNIDVLNAKRVGKGTEVTRLQTLLDNSQNEYNLLEQNLQQLQLTVAQLADVVKVIDSPNQAENDPQNKNTASVTLYVNQVTSTGNDDYSKILASERLAQTYGQMLERRNVLETVIKQLDLQITSDELAKRITVEPVIGTQLIRLSVWDANAPRAILLVNTLVDTFINQTQSLLVDPYNQRIDSIKKQMSDLSQEIEKTQNQLSALASENAQTDMDLTRLNSQITDYRNDNRALQQNYDQLHIIATETGDAVIILEPAQTPGKPIDRRLVNSALALMVGMMIGIGLVFLAEHLQGKIRTKQDVNTVLGINTLSTIGKLPPGEGELVIGVRSLSTISEDFRKLATKVRNASLDHPIKTLLVTSSSPSEGKSFIVANLAIALAQAGLRIVVIDADLRFPRIHKLFKIEQGKGLSEYLSGVDSIDKIHMNQVKDLQVITSGNHLDNPSEILNSVNMKMLFERLSQTSDLVLIDCPPILPVADTGILSSIVDASILVIYAAHTGSQAAKDSIESLKHGNQRLIGVVLNAMKKSAQSGRYYGSPSHNGKALPAMVNWKPPQSITTILKKK